jgi:hypothetical protein
MLSPKLYSGNLRNPKRLSALISQVARIDRLPPHNSAEAMHILRNAWDAVDVYHVQVIIIAAQPSTLRVRP